MSILEIEVDEKDISSLVLTVLIFAAGVFLGFICGESLTSLAMNTASYSIFAGTIMIVIGGVGFGLGCFYDVKIGIALLSGFVVGLGIGIFVRGLLYLPHF